MKQTPETDPRPELVAWFVALVDAHYRHDHREAAEALDALEQRGVTVQFRNGRKPNRRGTAPAPAWVPTTEATKEAGA